MFMPIGKPMSVGLGALDIGSIERAVRPTEAQRTAFYELKAISAKAEEAVRRACPGKPPATPLARLEMVEKWLDAMLGAVRALRPALLPFHSTLSEEQKTRFDAVGPGKGRGSQCHQEE